MPLSILKKKRSKLLCVKIATLDADLEFSVDQAAKAKSIFDLICHTIGLRESWYFGLLYTTSFNTACWLKLDRKILDQNVPKNQDGFIHLKFMAKFYPEVLEEELIQEVTRHMFYLQFQQQILSEELHCQPEASILLASYAVQAKFGDYDPEVHRPGFLADEVLLPQCVIDQFQSVTGSMWEEQITNWYAQHHGLTRDEAELEYLKIVQEFEMSGVDYFSIKDVNGTNMWLGVDAKSISFYPKSTKSNSIKSYQWSELSDMSYSGNKFTIKQTSKEGGGNGTLSRRRLNIVSSLTNINAIPPEEISFFVDNPDTNKLILDLCKGNHDLFMQRRKVDSMEIQQMKAQAREEKARKQTERTRLKKEKELRIQIQQEKEAVEEKLKLAQDEISAAVEALRKSEDANNLLSEKAKLAEEENMLLNIKVSQADKEIQRLKVEINQFHEENHQLKQKFVKFDQLTQQLTETSRNKLAEADKLRDEVNSLKMALADANKKYSIMAASSTVVHHSPNSSGNVAPIVYAMPVNQSISHNPSIAIHPSGMASQPVHPTSMSMPANPHHAQSYLVYSPAGSISGLTDGSNVSNRNSTEFSNGMNVEQLSQEIEKERLEYQLKNRNIEQQLQNLQSQIEVLKFDDKLPAYDQFPTSSVQYVPEQAYPPHNEVQRRSQYYEG